MVENWGLVLIDQNGNFILGKIVIKKLYLLGFLRPDWFAFVFSVFLSSTIIFKILFFFFRDERKVKKKKIKFQVGQSVNP